MRLPLGIAGVAVLLSLSFSFLLFPHLREPLRLNIDPDKCGELARNIWEGRGYVYDQPSTPAIDRGPVYPYVVAGIYWLVGYESVAAVQVFQALCHGLTCLVMLIIGRRLFTLRVALWTGWVCAVHPMLIWYTSRIWIETVHTLLVSTVLLSTILVVDRGSYRDQILLGVTLGVTILTKSVLLLFAPILGLFLILKRGRDGLRPALTILLTATLVVAPWTYRNLHTSGHFVPVHTSLGLNLIQGEAIGEYWIEMPLSTMALWQKGAERTQELLDGRSSPTDPAGDRLLVAASFSRSIDHPLFFLKKVLINAMTFIYLSESPAKSLFLMVIQFPLMILAFISSRKVWRTNPAVQATTLLIGYFFVCHLLVVGWARYSVPIVPACLLLASVVLERVGNSPRVASTPR